MVEIASFGLMGQGLRTVVPASKGDCLLEIPSTVWERFSAAKARASIDGALPDVVKRADEMDATLNVDAGQHGILALHLVLSFLAGHPYARTLPKKLNSPVFARDYSDGDFTMHDNDVADAVRARVALYMRMHEQMGLGSQIPFALFSWGLGTILSRAVRTPEMPYSIVPLLDFANHASNPDASIEFDKVRRSFMLTACRDIDSHTQVFIDYGAHHQSPLKFMLKYGFSVHTV